MDRRTLLAGMFALAAQPAFGRGPISGLPTLVPADFSPVVSGLEKAEGVAVASDGRLFLSDARSALAVLERNGQLRHIGRPIAPALTPTGRLVDIVYDPEGSRINMPTNLAWGKAGDLFAACRGAGTIVRARVSA